MKRLLLILCLLLFAARGLLLGQRCRSAGTVYADWSGIDAMSVPTVLYADTTGSGAQVGGSNWQWYHSAAAHTTTLTVTDHANESLCPAGHNCVVLQYATSDGSNVDPSHLFLSPSYSAWSADPSQKNGTSSSGGFWFQYYLKIDANTGTYLDNAGAGSKHFFDRYAIGDYASANDGGPEADGGYSLMQQVTHSQNWGGSAMVLDDSSAGARLQNGPYPNQATDGILFKCQVRRDTSANLGHMSCSADGTVIVDTETPGSQEGLPTDWNCTGKCVGCWIYMSDQCYGGNSNFGTSVTGQIMAFHLGIRYFAACTNSCANTTLKFVLSNIKVCDYNCVSYP